MKRIKMLGMCVGTVAILMAFAGIASAKLTSPEGTTYGGKIHAISSGNFTLEGTVDITCEASGLDASVKSGATSGEISWFYFLGCGKDTLNVISNGSLAIASNNTVTTTGTEITAQLHRTVFGFPVTTHCIYTTNSTKIGTLIEGAFPSLEINSTLSQKATDGGCGSESVLTGYYFILEPTHFYVD